MTKLQAFCWRSGEIEFTRGPIPEGAIQITNKKLSDAEFRMRVTTRSRRAYRGDTLLVPGIPEAEDEFAALVAFNNWMRINFPENCGAA